MDQTTKAKGIDKKGISKTLRQGLGTFGLICWAIMLAITFFETKPHPISANVNGVTFESHLDFLLKISALFLLFPFIFNLIKMCGELLIRENGKTVLINFIYDVMCEFGMFWAFIILGFFLLY